jgi:hypothetical protein
MTQHVFEDSVRDDTSLLIGVCGASGSGKTVTALRMAVGLAAGEPIAFIDTEAGRARHYFPTPSDTRTQAQLLKERLFRVRYLDMRPPYSPGNIWAAIETAIETVGAKVIVVDNMSDEWEGEGGLHQMHDEEIARLARKPIGDLQDWEMAKYNFPAWNVPKSKHKVELMKKLRQVRAHVIFCFRAEEKTNAVQVTEGGRTKTAIVNAGWAPIVEKRMLFDLTISFIVTPQAPGVPLMREGQAVHGKLNHPYLQFFPEGKQVTEGVGADLRAWAHGETKQSRPAAAPRQEEQGAGQSSQAPAPSHDRILLTEYHKLLAAEIDTTGLKESHATFKPRFGDDQATIATAGQILKAHNARLRGDADADATDVYVTGLIEEPTA